MWNIHSDLYLNILCLFFYLFHMVILSICLRYISMTFKIAWCFVLVVSYWNQIPEIVWKEERFAIAHSFGGFIAWPVSLVLSGPVMAHQDGNAWQNNLFIVRDKKEEEIKVSEVSSPAYFRCLKTSELVLLIDSYHLSVSPTWGPWLEIHTFRGHSRSKL